VAKEEWGNRFVCYSCGCKYYDLNRPEPLCPRCGADPKEVAAGSKATTRQSRASAPSETEEGDSEVMDDSVDVEFDASGAIEEEEVEDDSEEDDDEEF
jgi:uncharacterized protein (TIGR02300 family)